MEAFIFGLGIPELLIIMIIILIIFGAGKLPEIGAANIIWNPYEMTTFGLEYLWGRRENKDGADGTGSRFLFSSKFAF